MAQERKSTATFGQKSGENNTGYSQTMVKGENSRTSFARQHQGNRIGRDTEFRVEKDTKRWAQQNPERQLKWLRRIQDKAQSFMGIIPKDFYEDLSEAYYQYARVSVNIGSNTEAQRILAELLEDVQDRVYEKETAEEERQEAALEDEARRKVAKKKAEWIAAQKNLEQLENNRNITGPEFLELLRVYKVAEGFEAHQTFLAEFKGSTKKVDLIITVSKKVVTYLEDVYQAALEFVEAEYPGLYLYRRDER